MIHWVHNTSNLIDHGCKFYRENKSNGKIFFKWDLNAKGQHAKRKVYCTRVTQWKCSKKPAMMNYVKVTQEPTEKAPMAKASII